MLWGLTPIMIVMVTRAIIEVSISIVVITAKTLPVTSPVVVPAGKYRKYVAERRKMLGAAT